MTPALGPEQAQRLERCIAAGGVAVYPTDTVYGVCCDPDDERAARRLYELKGRPGQRSSAVMFFALDSALEALGELPEVERDALALLLPGPLTILLANRAGRFAPACRSDPATLGLRVPALGPRLAALGSLKRPLMQSSANLSGEPDARTLAEVPESLREGADLVLDGGALAGTPSTVVDLREIATDRRWAILREGAVAASELERLLAPLR